MPSGRTHDRLIWIVMPMVGFSASALTQDWRWGVITSSSFGLGGFFLSPDLDTPSLPYYRWGMLRGIWRPYQKLFRHRSLWTHGLLLGTLVRVLYLGGWLGLAIALGVGGLSLAGYLPAVLKGLAALPPIDWRWGVAIALGLELSALVHVSSDVVVSQWRRWHR